jgi:hypothetical protein
VLRSLTAANDLLDQLLERDWFQILALDKPGAIADA